MWPTIKISQAELDDLPVAESLEGCQSIDIRSAWQDMEGKWYVHDPKDGPHIVEIIPDATSGTTQREAIPRLLPPLKKLVKFRKAWADSHARGMKVIEGESQEDCAKRMEIFNKKHLDAIDYFDKQIAIRTTSAPVRSSLPKKKQRELGMLPPVTP